MTLKKITALAALICLLIGVAYFVLNKPPDTGRKTLIFENYID